METQTKHIDTGEKIGGARKDYARRFMTVQDLESMNDLERKTYVLKKNVWPTLDYRAMRENGVTPKAAVALKMVKDLTKTEPSASLGEQADEKYIEMVGVVRDRMASVKTMEDFHLACADLDVLREQTTGSFDYEYAIGRKAAFFMAENKDGRMNFDLRREIAKRERTLAGFTSREVTDEELWTTLVKPKREKSDEEREEESEKLKQDRELHRPHLEHVVREGGQDWRQGQDIGAEDLIEQFGFRAVEFGNWLPQDERQDVLNMAFDSFHDLAQALDIPPQGVSLDNELAIAFGSRGRGGKRAALAHFEPARFVINLTRMNGAGTLAHEWMHALDCHLGGKKEFLTESSAKLAQDSAMLGLVRAMMYRPSTLDEIHDEALKNVKNGIIYTLSWFRSQSHETREKLDNVLADLYQSTSATFKELALQHMQANLKIKEKQPDRWDYFLSNKRSFADFVARDMVHAEEDKIFQNLRAACDNKRGFTAVKEKILGNTRYTVDQMATACAISAARELDFPVPERLLLGNHAKETSFHAQAKKLDKTRSSPYWATPLEMFARAGAAYVSDQLEAQGVRSDYLVYGADEDQYTDHPAGNPNPTGEERKLFAEHFDKLVDKYRQTCADLATEEENIGKRYGEQRCLF